MNESDIEKRAQLLCQDLVYGVEKSSLCSLTTAIYDTAWLSMISKQEGGSARWLFPESFQYLLSQQLPGGGWAAYATREDGVLNSLAALLALKQHQTGPDCSAELHGAVQSAVASLGESLQTMDVDGSLPVGFEILVPALLAMLESEDVHLSSPATDALLAISQTKMKVFTPDLLYGTAETTLLHSLEAFVGKIDFNRIRHRKVAGSMMASPASTAAYLMNVSSWDDDAESYLREVVREGSGKGNGAVPSVFPTPIFEISWIISTLFQGGLSEEIIGQGTLKPVASYLEQQYHAQNGLLGFAPAMQADADDSAKAVVTLNLLGRRVCAKPLADHFRSKNGHFCTYPGERDASFSANCNVLRALLEAPDANHHVADMKSTLDFLCESWWSGAIKDKWNIASQYSMMLLAEALVRLFEIWDQGVLEQLPDTLLRGRLPVVLIQILNRTLTSQSSTEMGESSQPVEITAYVVLTLKAISSLPWLGLIQEDIASKIEASQQFLSRCRTSWKRPQYLWVEKVTYGSPSLSEGYYLAAITKPKQPYPWTKKVRDLVQISAEEFRKVTHLFRKLKCFQPEPAWKIRACVLEGLIFLPQLRSSNADVLGGEQSAKNEYLSFIPCTWATVNVVQNLFVDTYLLWDMMVLTLGNFRVDEYMETTIAELGEAELEEVKAITRTLCDQWGPEQTFHSNRPATSPTSPLPLSDSAPPAPSPPHETPAPLAPGPPMVASVRDALSLYIRTTLGHPRITSAPNHARSTLRTALLAFLTSHIDQSLTNAAFFPPEPRSPPPTPQRRNTLSFTEWLRTVAAPSVSAPFSFAFLACLIGGFPTPVARYLATDFGERVALMSRMYNDLGSVARDRAEANVNCVDFAELSDGHPPEVAKRRLLELAQYERDAAAWVGARLTGELRAGEVKGKGRRKVDAVRLFAGVSELYADMYEVRDLSNRVDGRGLGKGLVPALASERR